MLKLLGLGQVDKVEVKMTIWGRRQTRLGNLYCRHPFKDMEAMYSVSESAYVFKCRCGFEAVADRISDEFPGTKDENGNYMKPWDD